MRSRQGKDDPAKAKISEPAGSVKKEHAALKTETNEAAKMQKVKDEKEGGAVGKRRGMKREGRVKRRKRWEGNHRLRSD